MPYDRRKFSDEALIERTKEAHDRLNDYGKYGRFFQGTDGTTLNSWKCKEGEHIIDIIPFIAGSKHPLVSAGTPTYLVDLWIHQKIGAGESDYVCPARNFKKRCPICEYQLKKLQNPNLTELQEHALKKLDPKRRCLYNIVCYDSEMEADKGVQLWEIAHFLFEKKILAIARNPRGGGFIPFSSPDRGFSIYFERQGSGMENTQYLGHKFIPREEVISDHVLQSAHTLDELIVEKSYDELRELFYSGVLLGADDSASPDNSDQVESGGQRNTVKSRLEAAKKAPPVGTTKLQDEPAPKTPLAEKGATLEPEQKKEPEQTPAASVKPPTRRRRRRI